MTFDRRALLGAGALAALSATSAAAQPAAPSATSAAATPTLEQRLSARAAENRLALTYADGRFSGPGWDLLLAEARQAKFFLLGEEHGIAENPRLAAALFTALAPEGYDKLVIETSPLMAAELDRAAAGGLDGLRKLFADPGSQAAFFGMREEAELLAAARKAGPRGRPVLWGLDYDVAADRLAIARLKNRPKPAAAERALAALEDASTASWAKYAETRGPQYIFNFSGDPALVRAVRQAWPKADPDSVLLLETLEQTLEINRLFGTGRNQESNQRRAEFNKANLLRYWRAERAAGRSPKLLFKFGASHMVRGLNTTEAFDIGALAPELAAIEGGGAFHLLVLPGKGREVARFDPSAWTYRPGPVAADYALGLEPLIGQALPEGLTLIDLRPLRGLLASRRAATVHRELARTVHGFDALLVMTGSTPSTNL